MRVKGIDMQNRMINGVRTPVVRNPEYAALIDAVVNDAKAAREPFLSDAKRMVDAAWENYRRNVAKINEREEAALTKIKKEFKGEKTIPYRG